MRARNLERLQNFYDRVRCVEKSKMAPNPASPITEDEILEALCILVVDKIESEKKKN